MNNEKGFTLVELVIVIIIIGVLAVVGVPSFQRHVRKSYAAEGKALLISIAMAEKMYFIDNHAYHDTGNAYVGVDTALGVDAQSNTYFQTFLIGVDNTPATENFTAWTVGVGDAQGILGKIHVPLNCSITGDLNMFNKQIDDYNGSDPL